MLFLRRSGALASRYHRYHRYQWWALVSFLLILGGWGWWSLDTHFDQDLQETWRASSAYHVVEGRHNSVGQRQQPYVILISIDGFRHDYLQLKPRVGHFLRSLYQRGSSAQRLIPGFPSATFPNHYSLVTGLYPGHHGLVANQFFDPQRSQPYNYHNSATVRDGSWYRGEPVWVVAERAGMLTASFFWVGSEAKIQGFRPTYYYDFDDKISHRYRLRQVRQWLALPEEKRPHFLTLYFSEVDRAGHAYGPQSPEVDAAIETVDQTLQQLVRDVASTSLPVHFVLVSDHGMQEVSAHETIMLQDLAPTRLWSSVRIEGSGAFFMLHAKDAKTSEELFHHLKRGQRHYQIFKRQESPAHYRARQASRMGDYLLVADPPYYFTSRSLAQNQSPRKGTHGWDPYLNSHMAGIFLAWGPNLRAGQTLSSIEAVDVYPFLLRLLGLQSRSVYDGKESALLGLLKP